MDEAKGPDFKVLRGKHISLVAEWRRDTLCMSDYLLKLA